MEILLAVLVGSGCAALGAWLVRRRGRRRADNAAAAADGGAAADAGTATAAGGAAADAGTAPAAGGATADAGGAGAASVQRELDDLRPDDVLIIESRDWIVAGACRLEEGMDAWLECLLRDGDDVRWLVVRPGEDGTTAGVILLGCAVADPGVGHHPSEALEREGRVYRLARFGRTVTRVVGSAGDLTDGELGYWDYERPGDHRAWIRGHGETWLYVFGERVARHLIRFLPGS
jgi:hypothetical protein